MRCLTRTSRTQVPGMCRHNRFEPFGAEKFHRAGDIFRLYSRSRRDDGHAVAILQKGGITMVRKELLLYPHSPCALRCGQSPRGESSAVSQPEWSGPDCRASPLSARSSYMPRWGRRSLREIVLSNRLPSYSPFTSMVWIMPVPLNCPAPPPLSPQ